MAKPEKETGIKNTKDAKNTKNENGVLSMLKSGLANVSQMIASSVFAPIKEGIQEGAEKIMDNIEDRMLRIEKRIIKKTSNLIIIGFGAVFLILALLFFLIDFLNWTKYAAFFSIGIIIFVAGLLLKVAESGR